MAVRWGWDFVPIGPQRLRRPQVFEARCRQSRRAILRAPCWRESLVVATHGRHKQPTCLGEKSLGTHMVREITRETSPHPHKTMQSVREMVLRVGASMVPRISHHYIGGGERTGGLTTDGSDGNDDWRSGLGSALVKEKGGVSFLFLELP